MKYDVIKKAVMEFAAKNDKQFTEESHFENGYGSKYIIPDAGTIGLKSADARLGNRFAIVNHLEGGCISVISGYLTPFKLIEWMQENELN